MLTRPRKAQYVERVLTKGDYPILYVNYVRIVYEGTAPLNFRPLAEPVQIVFMWKVQNLRRTPIEASTDDQQSIPLIQ